MKLLTAPTKKNQEEAVKDKASLELKRRGANPGTHIDEVVGDELWALVLQSGLIKQAGGSKNLQDVVRVDKFTDTVGTLSLQARQNIEVCIPQDVVHCTLR